MITYTKQTISNDERALIFKNQTLKKVLKPGKHTLWSWNNAIDCQKIDLDDLIFNISNPHRLYQSASCLKEHISVYQLEEYEAGLVYLNNKFRGIIPPGESVYLWQDAGDITLEKVDLRKGSLVEPDLLARIETTPDEYISTPITHSLENVTPISILEIKEDHIGFLFVDNVLVSELSTGRYGVWDFGRKKIELKTYNCREISAKPAQHIFNKHDNIKSILFHQVGENEVGLLFINQILSGILPPGEQVFLWKEAGDISIKSVNISENIYLSDAYLKLIKRFNLNTQSNPFENHSDQMISPVLEVDVHSEHIGLLYINNQLVQELSPGCYGLWQYNRDIKVKVFDCRACVTDISGQEILTKDRVSLRINLTARYQIVHAVKAASAVEDIHSHIYTSLQLALRESVGTQNLDNLLIDKLYINETIKDLVDEQFNELGIQLLSVGVKDIILPGEMKAILNQVVEAQKAAEANVIKRREETAATRSLHNTAKVIENNPTLMRLKELEALEKVADKIDSLTVYGGLEGLMNNAIKLN